MKPIEVIKLLSDKYPIKYSSSDFALAGKISKEFSDILIKDAIERMPKRKIELPVKYLLKVIRDILTEKKEYPASETNQENAEKLSKLMEDL